MTAHLATIPAGELTRVRIRDEHKKFEKRLERAGVRGLLIGGTEADWDHKNRVLILHLHIVSIGVDLAAWDRLAPGRGNDRAIPIKRELLKDAIRPLSYKQKWMPYFRPRRRVGHKLSRPVPLKPRQLAELCRWWACHRFEDFMFLYGARRRGGRIVPETRVAEVGPVGNPRVIFSRTFTVESIQPDRTIRFTWRDEISVADQISASQQGSDQRQGEPRALPDLPDLPNLPMRKRNDAVATNMNRSHNMTSREG